MRFSLPFDLLQCARRCATIGAENPRALHSARRQGGPIPCRHLNFTARLRSISARAEAKVGEAVKHFGGTKVFIVYGGHSAVKSGLIARIEQTLTDAGLEHMSFGGVQPNPRLSHAREGVQKALAFGADFILGVGGGAA